MKRLGRINLALTLAANKRGVYTGARAGRLHVALYRGSNGRIGGHLPGMPEAHVLLLDHVGAKSGLKRTSPLICFEDGEIVAVVASKAGQPSNPAWYHNLRANPRTTVQIGAEVRQVRARDASEEERQRLWPKLVALFPGYESFQEWAAADRQLPIVVLEPTAS